MLKLWQITTQAYIDTEPEEFEYFPGLLEDGGYIEYAHTQLYKDKALCFVSFDDFAEFIDVDPAALDKPNLELSILNEFYPLEIAKIERVEVKVHE